MGRIPEATIEAIRERIDIVDLIGRHVALRQAGRSFKGLCPFHDEKTPSFHVNPERAIFHCFGCGAGGDAFRFLMRHENLTFPEAIRSLARECGIEVPETGSGDAGLSERLSCANDTAQDLYRRSLSTPEGSGARAYLASRGLAPDAIERFGLGFVPDRWDSVRQALVRAGIAAEVGEQAGLLAERRGGGHYDRLRGRLTFPIQDARGRVIAFGGRALGEEQEPKYLNTPESPLFRKREALYGFPEALEPIRRSGRAVVVEGYFDRIALALAGVSESLATCGTALTQDHARNLRRRTREVVLLFDGDAAGQRAVERSLQVLLPEALRVRAGQLPAGEDPASLLEKRGPDALRRVVNEAPPALQVVIRAAVQKGCATPWEKADAVGSVVRLLALVPDPVERGEFARQLALAADVRSQDVEAALRRERRPSGMDPEEALRAAPRRIDGPEVRALARLVRTVIEHPSLARPMERREIEELAGGPPWDAIALGVFETCDADGKVDVAALAERLDDEARATLLALVVTEHPVLSLDEARRAVGDTIRWLRRRRQASARRATTRRFRDDPNADPRSLLAKKQEQLEERKLAQGLVPGPAPR